MDLISAKHDTPDYDINTLRGIFDKLYQSAVAQTPVPSSMLQPNDYMINHLIATFNIATLLNKPKTIDRMVKPDERFEFRIKCVKCEKYIKFQRKHMEYISNMLSNTHLPLPIIAKGLTVWCPYCHHKIPYPKSVVGISDHKYVPTLAERAIEHDSVLSETDCYDGNPYLHDLKVHWLYGTGGRRCSRNLKRWKENLSTFIPILN